MLKKPLVVWMGLALTVPCQSLAKPKKTRSTSDRGPKKRDVQGQSFCLFSGVKFKTPAKCSPHYFFVASIFPALCQAPSMGSLLSTFSMGDCRQRNALLWVEPEPQLEYPGIFLMPRLLFLLSNDELVLFLQQIGLKFAVFVNSDFSVITNRSVLWSAAFH